MPAKKSSAKKTKKKAASKSPFDSVESVIADIRRGKMVIVVDDEDRENEGDLIMAAEHATPKAINFMAKHGRGLICVPTTEDRLRQLGIERMVPRNQESFQTDFQVSVDAAKGITTGISAKDRAKTIQTMADPTAVPDDLVQPGHIFPLRARPGGVLQRAGHTEAAVDLTKLAECRPIGVICEIMDDSGNMARLPKLKRFAKAHKLKICSIEELIKYRRSREKLIEKLRSSISPASTAISNCIFTGARWTARITSRWFVETWKRRKTSWFVSIANALPAMYSEACVVIAVRNWTTPCGRSLKKVLA